MDMQTTSQVGEALKLFPIQQVKLAAHESTG